MESENKPPEEPHPDEPRESDVPEQVEPPGTDQTASEDEEPGEGTAEEPSE